MILAVLAAAGVAPVAPLPLPDMRTLDDLAGVAWETWPGDFLDGDFRAFDERPYLAA